MKILGLCLALFMYVMEPAPIIEIVQVPKITDDERVLIAHCVEAEAGNQDLEGKRLVVDVILNRVDSPDFPDTVYDVITQPYQFSVWGNGMLMEAFPTEETMEAIDLELEERLNSDIVYFNSIGFKYGTPWKKVGAHYFSY